MTWTQKQIVLNPYRRGFHLITDVIISQLPEILKFRIGFANFFLQHTSAGLTINENADPTVRKDFETYLNHLAPEDAPFYAHTCEGSDDMPAHLKSSLLGNSLQIPITNGRLGLGTWQGIYLCEYRNHGGSRKILCTLVGEVKDEN